ncbi:MAG: prolipoprotein diacylglyceryl transferase [Tepidisphaeraceae bacterium]|jgi:phosphatidylglycerol:prolipoprotein diacylglycerol transferase
MLQVLFRIHLFGHVIPVYGYGLMLVIAFLACVQTSRWLAVRKGMNPDHFVDAALIAMATGVIGARLCHVLENIHEYTRADLTLTQNLFNVANTREGGLTFYGGFLLATPCVIAYGLWRKAKILVGMDIVAPVVMIGLGIGRIGCFLNGCCYGAQCDLPWAVRFPYYSNAYLDQYAAGKTIVPADLTNALGAPLNPDVLSPSYIPRFRLVTALPVHPTQLYSSFTAFLLAVLLIVYLGLPHLDGRVFALMLILEGLARYVLEMIRVEPAVFTLRLHGQSYAFSISMILGLAAIVAGFVLWILLGHRLAGWREGG